MIRYLRHQEIDRERWDACIARSLNRRVYAFSWYLDIVSPGWEALVGGDYSAVFPLTWKKKWSVHYLAQPWFTQQLGVFSPDPVSEEQLGAFIGNLPAHLKFAEIHLNAMNPPATPSGRIRMRANYELPLSDPYGDLSLRYDANTRRNVKKSLDRGVVKLNGLDIRDLVSLFKAHFGRKEGKLGRGEYRLLHELLKGCRERGNGAVAAAGTASGVLCAAAFFLTDAGRTYFLFAASAPEARENGAMFFLVDHYIREHAGSDLVLDFEGSNDPGVARFYRGFGALGKPYPMLRIQRLGGVAGAAHFLREKLRQR